MHQTIATTIRQEDGMQKSVAFPPTVVIPVVHFEVEVRSLLRMNNALIGSDGQAVV